VIWNRCRVSAIGGVLAVGLLVLVVAGAVPSRSEAGTSERSEEAECISAATEIPRLLRVHFILHRQPPRELNHRETFVPQADIRFAIPPMPDGCVGKIGRRLEVKVRFKSSLQAPMTVKGDGWDRRPSLWQAVFDEDVGSGGCECGRPQLGRDGGGWEYSRDFGRVQWVEAHARLSATNSKTGAIVGRQVVAIPATFTAKSTLSNH
jgi:hypothetical protein